MGPTFKSAVHGGCEGMEPDDLLCSRNARSKTPLVGRAQWKTNQPPFLRNNERAWRAREGTAWLSSCPRNAHDRNVLARVNGTSRRASGWAGEKVPRNRGSTRLAPRDGKSSLEGTN